MNVYKKREFFLFLQYYISTVYKNLDNAGE